MRSASKVLFWLFVALTALALVVSASLLVDYVRPAPVFCGDVGCAAVKRTSLAYPLRGIGIGLPMPAIGLVGLLLIGLLALVPGRRARLAQATFAGVGGVVAGFLIFAQWKMGTFCPSCVVTDVTALVLAGLAFARFARGWDPPTGLLVRGIATALLVSAAVVPAAVGITRRSSSALSLWPVAIATEVANAPKGKIVVVDFVDFECPFCRSTHAQFAPLLAARKDKIHLVRRHIPLPMHDHAKDAARAAICAEKMGKGPEVEEKLFKAEPDALSPEGCEKIATASGLDLARFRTCVTDPAIDARLREDRAMFEAADSDGLPTIWIQAYKLEGEQEREPLETALDEAIRAL